MPAYTYTGTDARYYPSLGLHAEPGVTADFDEPPADGRWQPASGEVPPASAPAADPAPTPTAPAVLDPADVPVAHLI